MGIRLEEELPYEVLRNVGDIEVRKYAPFTLARVLNSGDYEEASEKSFLSLANFIFGENTQGLRTSMTAPVFLDQQADGWVMSFYIPFEHSGLVPKDRQIWIQEMPEKVVAVYRYSGTNDQSSMEEAKQRLMDEVRAAGLESISHVWWAVYDQPVSIPALKRNEALVRIRI
jgi:hypothetical protein